MPAARVNPATHALKRALDLLVGVPLSLLGLPVVALAAIAILFEDGRPVLFRQARAGAGGRVFTALKLRSMRTSVPPPDQIGQVHAGHPDVTRVGAVIRRLRVDELPQLWHVLTGDMALVGPRPTLPEQVGEYSEFERLRLTVRPGLTGWAQVNGNVSLPWPDRIKLDVWYVRHWSLGLDIAILAKTAWVIIAGERTNEEALNRARAEAA